MRLKFYYDFDEDLRLVNDVFSELRRVFGKKSFEETLHHYYPDCPVENEEITRWLKKNKEEIMEKTRKEGKKVEKDWKKVEKQFFRQVEEITGFKWRFRVYRCHLSSSFFIGGCYDADEGDKISIFPQMKHIDPVNTIMHELIHLHFWDFIDKLGIETGNQRRRAKGKFWDLSEVEVNVLMKELKIKNFKTDTCVYPQHKELWEKVKKIRKKNPDYKQFLLKVVEALK